jgi:small subunit ribosomal protein S6
LLRKYEGMFLFNPAVTPDWDGVQAEITRLMERAEGRVIAAGKWDERRLAYEIQGCRRGIYALVYFEVDAGKIADIERDVRLSESALRCMIVRVDHMNEEDMVEAATKPAAAPEDDRPRRRDFGSADAKPAESPKAAEPAKAIETVAVEEAPGEEAPASEIDNGDDQPEG